MKLLLAALALTSAPALAAPDYRYCEITGLALGADKTFVGTVAKRAVERQGLFGDTACMAVWKDAYQNGRRMSLGSASNTSQLDVVNWQKLQDFENRIADAVIGQLHLDDVP